MNTRRLLIQISVFALVVAACATPSPTPQVVVVARTAGPTWTLPFDPDAPITPQVLTTPLSPEPTATPAEPGTPTPTARPGIDPTLGAATPNPFVELSTPIPEPMPQLFLDEDVINILLLGRDTAKENAAYRTDVMIVVSVHKANNTVTLLTLPRDLFVYIPGWTMNRLNTASGYGDSINYPGGGVALLEQTILYNLGIPLHGWARIDFGGFKQMVDILGGVQVPVSCAMQDWRLKDPYNVDQDVQDANNWHLYTVETGLQSMDGDLALWYARSRKRSSDFDRSRRQHQVLRAMLEKALQLNMLPKAPELYQQAIQIVDTDLTIGDVLQFVPMLANIENARIKSRFIGRDQVFSWTTPQGAAVLLPDREAVKRVVAEAFEPPAENVLARTGPAVEIWNGTSNASWTALAADNAEWAGISAVISAADRADYATTTLYDFTTSPKGSIRSELQRVFNVSDANIVAAPDANAAYPYRVVLGADYVSCVKPQTIIRSTQTPEPGNTAAALVLNEADIVHSARIIEVPPKLDGDLAEWTALVYPINSVSFGAPNRASAADISGSWSTAWDDKYLYLAVKAKDDALAQLAKEQDLFKGDGLEIWLSTEVNNRGEQLTERDFQFGLTAGNGLAAPDAFLWLPNQFKGRVQDAVIAARPLEGGYGIEMAVPWSVFRLTPFAGQSFGFTLALNDDDTAASAEQETQVTSMQDAKLNLPRTWGVLVLDP